MPLTLVLNPYFLNISPITHQVVQINWIPRFRSLSGIWYTNWTVISYVIYWVLWLQYSAGKLVLRSNRYDSMIFFNSTSQIDYPTLNVSFNLTIKNQNSWWGLFVLDLTYVIKKIERHRFLMQNLEWIYSECEYFVYWLSKQRSRKRFIFLIIIFIYPVPNIIAKIEHHKSSCLRPNRISYTLRLYWINFICKSNVNCILEGRDTQAYLNDEI